MSTWPFPGDTPLIRARKLAQAYRAHLKAAAPHLCAQIDEMAIHYGELWVVPRVVTTTDNDLLTPAEAADFLCVSTANVRRLRLAGRLHGVRIDGQWRYRVAELRKLQQGRPRTALR